MEQPDLLEQILMGLPKKTWRSARPFYARAEEDDDRPSGDWGAATIRIFHDENQIGAYRRNYPSFGAETFEPFELDGRWYALYSSDYTCTRVMTLPDCRDIGGEEPNSGGFCPVQLFVPRYRRYSLKNRNSGDVREFWLFESGADGLENKIDNTHETIVSPWQCLSIGFVSGCIWGDDSSWKLQTIDLSRAPEGIIKREKRFGHVEIAAGLPLAAAVQLYRSVPDPLRARILREEIRDVDTGKRVDPYSDELID